MTPARPVLLLLAVFVFAAAPASAGGSAPSARVWLTTGDRASLLAEQPPDALHAPDPGAPTIAVDPARAYQRIEGLGGPHNGGCGTCNGVVTIDPSTGRATPDADYYVLGHVTRFIRPGAVRVDSTVAGNAWSVAFRNPDGSLVLVVVNDDWGTTAQRFSVRAAGRSFSYELPAGAVATFVIT